jgi:adenosylmethionine-8-amino-7-oxononanoate aminotransferase
MPRKRKPQYVYEVERQMNNLQWITEAFFRSESEAKRLAEILEQEYPAKSLVTKPFRVNKHEIKKIEEFENNS